MQSITARSCTSRLQMTGIQHYSLLEVHPTHTPQIAFQPTIWLRLAWTLPSNHKKKDISSQYSSSHTLLNRHTSTTKLSSILTYTLLHYANSYHHFPTMYTKSQTKHPSLSLTPLTPLLSFTQCIT
ncbi:hypothetical protein M758_UG031100 [Ceratodon purpureus]|nr:hypothetical protein M758_UG031100 [Ceratodon purpureus]